MASVVVRRLPSRRLRMGWLVIVWMIPVGIMVVAWLLVRLSSWLLVVRALSEEQMIERWGWKVSALLLWWKLAGSSVSLSGARVTECFLVVLMTTVATVLWLLTAVKC